MTAVLGIDAAWTARQPSGVALVTDAGGSWRVAGLAPSYGAFVAQAAGEPVDWGAKRFEGESPDVGALLAAARRLVDDDICVVAVDMPLATVEFSTRREADRAASRAFARFGCATHSPTPERPGPLGAAVARDLATAGFALATADRRPSPCTVEVYPHPALLRLLSRDYRVPYKASRSLKYWPGEPPAARVRKLLLEFAAIADALAVRFGPLPLTLPHADEVETLAGLKRYEDALDALVCAWVAVCVHRGRAEAYGDGTAAIWVPRADA